MIDHREQIIQIAISKERKKYKGSDLGLLWSFVKPSLYICAFYVAICIGFKSSKDVQSINCSYFVWLTVGLVAWFYMRDMVLGGASCFNKNKLLVTKLGFPLEAVPAIPAFTSLFIHSILMIGVFVLSICCGDFPTLYWLQLPVYTILMVMFAIVWSFMSGCLAVLSKDFFNLLKSINVVIFWLSGILFDPTTKGSGAVVWFFRFNPVTYIAEGYRNCLCKSVWIFEKPVEFVCFMITTLIFMTIGLLLYKRIRKDLPDIL